MRASASLPTLPPRPPSLPPPALASERAGAAWPAARESAAACHDRIQAQFRRDPRPPAPRRQPPPRSATRAPPVLLLQRQMELIEAYEAAGVAATGSDSALDAAARLAESSLGAIEACAGVAPREVRVVLERAAAAFSTLLFSPAHRDERTGAPMLYRAALEARRAAAVVWGRTPSRGPPAQTPVGCGSAAAGGGRGGHRASTVEARAVQAVTRGCAPARTRCGPAGGVPGEAAAAAREECGRAAGGLSPSPSLPARRPSGRRRRQRRPLTPSPDSQAALDASEAERSALSEANVQLIADAEAVVDGRIGRYAAEVSRLTEALEECYASAIVGAARRWIVEQKRRRAEASLAAAAGENAGLRRRIAELEASFAAGAEDATSERGEEGADTADSDGEVVGGSARPPLQPRPPRPESESGEERG